MKDKNLERVLGWRWRNRHLRRRQIPGVLELERKLEEKLLRLPIPVRPKLALALVHFAAGQLERDRFVRLTREEEILPLLVGGFDLLFVGGHESVARDDALGNLGIIDLEKKRLLPGIRLPLLRHFVTGPTDLHKLSHLNFDLLGRRLSRCIKSFLGGSSGQVRLMLFALSVSQITAFVVVQSETKFAFIGAQVIFHEVRILLDVDGF